jgi:hypothetical protein
MWGKNLGIFLFKRFVSGVSVWWETLLKNKVQTQEQCEVSSMFIKLDISKIFGNNQSFS